MDTPHGVSAASGRCGLRTVCAFSIADAVSGAMSMAAWRSSTLHDETRDSFGNKSATYRTHSDAARARQRTPRLLHDCQSRADPWHSHVSTRVAPSNANQAEGVTLAVRFTDQAEGQAIALDQSATIASR
jgi:hypothetical protein